MPLDRVTLDGHAGKLNRQILRRAERDGVTVPRAARPRNRRRGCRRSPAISDDWLRAKRCASGSSRSASSTGLPAAASGAPSSRKSAAPSAGSSRSRTCCAGPDAAGAVGRSDALRSDAPQRDGLPVRLAVSLRQGAGYRRFNLGMAPLASVGELPGAHARERLASAALPARGALVQLPGTAATTRRSSSPSGCHGTWRTRTRGNGRRPSRT